MNPVKYGSATEYIAGGINRLCRMAEDIAGNVLTPFKAWKTVIHTILKELEGRPNDCDFMI